MSEKQPNFESNKGHELDPKKFEKLADEKHEQLIAEAEKVRQQNPEKLEELHKLVEQAAKSKEEMAEANKVDTDPNNNALQASTSHRTHSYKRRINTIQHQESATDRAFSKVIHNPIVEAVSDAAEGTVARPSGLLFAGIFAAASGIAVLYICKHYGYEYNFTISLAAMGLGFIAGIILEGAWKLLKRK